MSFHSDNMSNSIGLNPQGLFSMGQGEEDDCSRLTGIARALCERALDAGLSYDKRNKALNFGDSGFFLSKDSAGFRFPFGN